MKSVWVLLTLIGITAAQYSNSLRRAAYGAPSIYGVLQSQEYFGGQELEEDPIETVRHVYVHIAPDDKASGIARVIKAPIKRERQVNILFVKAPAPAAPDRQIVDIPNDGGRKTLVYVLLKKTDAAPDVDFKTPPPTAPSKPEIYFIRYKDPKTAAPGTEYGTPGGRPIPLQGQIQRRQARKSRLGTPVATRPGGGGY